MNFSNVVQATFLKRVNRFVAEARLSDGVIVQAHVANTGRMAEPLIEGVPCLLAPAENSNRKTAWSLLAVEKDSRWVCLMAVWANDFLEAWLRAGVIEGFERFDELVREKAIGKSRFDFMLSQGDTRWLIEVKSVNYVIDGQAYFPDAPTSRGRQHVEKLLALREEGWKVGVVFVTMGQEVDAVRFNKANDPQFADMMQKARASGIYIKAFSAGTEPPQVVFKGERPILWE